MSDQKREDSWPPPPACYDCNADPTGRLEQMFVEIVQKRRIALGQSPAERPVFRKTHGVAAARLVVEDDLPAELKVGLFGDASRREYAAWLRSSSDTSPTSPDVTTTLGLALKIFDVPGDKLYGSGTTADFIFQNHDVFFVDTAKDMCEFTYAGVVQGDYDPYLAAHPTTDRILKEMAKVEGSVLSTTYWSVLPFRFGANGTRIVKYKLAPHLAPANVPDDDADYLARDLALRLRHASYRFGLYVQFQTNEQDMPSDAATVRWSESASEPRLVATLILPEQEVSSLGQTRYGENLSFNIWRTTADHEPVGSLALARRNVYSASAHVRRDANGTSLDEPSEPRPPPLDLDQPPAAVTDRCIVAAAIHPSIGIARVGNSPDEFFLAPEVPEPEAPPPGSHRDGAGRLKRQGVCFHIYGLNAQGQIVEELTAANASVRWTGHLVNQKSSWYQFQLALDIPEADSAPPTLLRNSSVSDRNRLTIDPGPRSLDGVPGAPPAPFDGGTFMGKEVYLGELRTDEHGRLIVLGGRGVSASYDDSRAITFANNEGWHDDTADGPITAEVTYQGKPLAVSPAWCVVAPPDYAPMQKSVRTMWDLMRDVAIKAGTLARPARPSFQRDIRPIFERLSRLQWVNAGFAAAFGWQRPFDLSTNEWLLRLNDPHSRNREMRHMLANQFREFDRDAWSPIPWPWLYGDAMNVPPAETPRQHATLTDTQLLFLQQWGEGDFYDDYNNSPPLRRLADYPVEEQGDVLDRASLEMCLADAFHPGCEMTWPVRHSSMYMAPFRWKHGTGAEPQYGAALTSDSLTLPNGPLSGQYPGSITRWMAVPWQTDTASCRSGYSKAFDPYLPTFWPARVPNQVLSKQNYDVVMDASLPLAERLAAFANRAAWTRPIDRPSYTDTINTFIAHIDWVGIVEPWPGPGDDSFPSELQVEDHAHSDDEEATATKSMNKSSGAVHRPARLGDRRVVAGGAVTHEASREATEAVERELVGIEKARRFPNGLRRR